MPFPPRHRHHGCGGCGRQGHGDTDDRLVLTLDGAGAFGGSAVLMAARGSEHTLVMTHDGAHVWACGEEGKVVL